MKSEDLLRALGQIEDAWIEEAAPTARQRRSTVGMKWISIAACLLVVTIAGIGVATSGWHNHPVEVTPDVDIDSPLPTGTPDLLTEPTTPAVTSDHSTNRTTVTQTTTPTNTTDAGSTQASTPEIALIPPWDDRTISQQFAEVSFNNLPYTSRATALAADRVGERLGTATLNGYDIYTDAAYTANATIFAIRSISSACAIALQFEGREDYYVYVYSWYQPPTLGDFITVLNLRETLTVGSVWSDSMEYTGLSDDVVWQMLLCDPSVEAAVDFDPYMSPSAMSVSVSVPLLGYQNVSLAVTEDGYLTTNILDTGKAFFIGQEAVQRFINYVTEHGESRAVVYDTTGIGIPE